MSNFNQKLQGLLGSPTFNLGLGLLSASGNRRGPKRSFGQVLAEGAQFANQQQSQYQQLQLQRNLLSQRKDRQEAIKELGGLLSQPSAASIPPMVRRPGAVQAQQDQLQVLLAKINPEQFTSSLIQSQFAQPKTGAVPREATLAAQMFPGESLETSIPKVMQMLNPTDPQQELEVERLRLQIDELLAGAQDRRDSAVEEEAQEVQQTGIEQNSIDTSINIIGGIATNLNKIKGTLLQPGAPMPSLRRTVGGALSFGRDLLGMDNRKQQELNTALDLVNKDLNGLVLDTLQTFQDGLTVQQTRILQDASANENITPQAIASVLEVALDARKFAAENNPDLSLRNGDQVEAIEALLQQIKSFDDSGQKFDWSSLPK